MSSNSCLESAKGEGGGERRRKEGMMDTCDENRISKKTGVYAIPETVGHTVCDGQSITASTHQH